MLPFFNKKPLFLLLTLIFVGVSSASNLFAEKQTEEGWRWRESLNYKMGDQIVDAQRFHEELSRWEEAIFEEFHRVNNNGGDTATKKMSL